MNKRKIFIILLMILILGISNRILAQARELIIYYYDNGMGSGRNVVFKVPNNEPINLYRLNYFRSRGFVKLTFTDTGVLKPYFYTGGFGFVGGIRFDDRLKYGSININYVGTKWLCIAGNDSIIYKLQNELPVSLLTNEEFAARFKKAYKKYKRRGPSKLLENVPLNIAEKSSPDETKYRRKKD